MSAVTTLPRLGFLGVGRIGRMRLDSIAAAGVAELAALADVAVDGALGSFEELLAEELDGVVIATPSSLHREQAIAALERGLAVFCQKPLALDAEGAREVVEAARAADRLLAVDLGYRHVEAVRRVGEAVASGELGEVFAADLVFHNAYGPDRAWFFDPRLSGGGCVIDLGIHLVDLVLCFLRPSRVSRVTSVLRNRPVEDYAAVQLELESGAVARISCSWGLPAGRDCVFEASFYGTAGGASVRNVGGSYFDFVAERFDGTQTTRLAEPPDDWSGRAAVEWAQRLGEGAGFSAEACDLVRLHELIDLIYESAR